MVYISTTFATLFLAGAVGAQCPYADPVHLAARAAESGSSETAGSRGHMKEYEFDDSEGFLTSDVGGPMSDQESLKSGERGSTLLEDFIFRQKMTHFDHERVPERAVHARGTGAYGTFTSYDDFSNLTAASFLGAKDKKTPMFVRFSTVVGSRGSADTVRDVRGFATRFYTDEGNYDIVGNNAPVFFIQDAIHFPDLVHSVKPEANNEIPQASTAHDTAWDFFSQQTTALHTLFWALSGHGVPRSYRHMDGFGVHTYRFVTDDGDSRLIKWHWRTKQGLASLFQDESQHINGKNADYHRQDLYDAIESGNYPEWELAAQIVDEDKALAFGFDLLDPTKFLPEEFAPLQPLGVMRLDANPVNYFAETEQVMFQPGHIVRGIDFTEDPLLQGRIFSYLDTQINRHGGPNFEQIPINRPIGPIHNNNRDGAAQNFIHRNKAPYFPNTLNNGYPRQANQTTGKGFFTAPGRKANGNLVRERSETFADHWSQPRLFYNSLSEVEQQMLIDVLRFEMSVLQPHIQKNMLAQLNKISHDIAVRVGQAIDLEAPAADDTYYHGNKTTRMSTYGEELPTIAALRLGVLVASDSEVSLSQAKQIKDELQDSKLFVTVVGDKTVDGIDKALSAIDATGFDGIVVTDGTAKYFDGKTRSTFFPAGRPTQIVTDSYYWGKPLGFLGEGKDAIKASGVKPGPGVYEGSEVASVVKDIKGGLATFKFLDRIALDEDKS